MIYRVLLDNNDILDYDNKDCVLLSPQLDMELNAAGSFQFTMPPNHIFHSNVQPLVSTVEIYEDDDLVWYGRPIEVETDFYKQKNVYCEGAMSYFNDTIQRPHEYNSIYIHEFFRTVIASHNQQVSLARQFTVGNITVENAQVYRNLRYESTYDTLKRQCLNSRGGYFFFRRVNGVNYIDWLEEMPYTCNQPVEFGLNLLDISSTFDGGNFYTCVVPLGDEDLTVAEVNSGSDLIVSEAAQTYGNITKVVRFNDVKYADTLYDDGIEFLEEHQFDDLVIECTAAELHNQNPNYEHFRVGQMVRCHSVPHLLDKNFPLTKLSISLDTAAKEIQLGTRKQDTLTEIMKSDSESVLFDMESKLDTAIWDVQDDMESKLDTAILDLQDGFDSQIDAIIGTPSLDDFSTGLDDIDWGSYFPNNEVPSDLQGLLDQFKYSTSLPDMSDALKDFQSKLNDYKTDFGDDYDRIKPIVDSLSKDLGLATNPQSSFQQGQNIQGLSDRVTAMGTQISDLSSQVEDLSGASKWVFQVNGQTLDSGTVNFVT